MDFTGFLGNDAVKARLSGAFASGRVAHSYLICGPVGSGKHTLTRILCAAMQCEGRGEKIPCGVCSGCRMRASTRISSPLTTLSISP